MSEKPIGPLHQRMIEDMSVRNFVEKTRNDYIRHVTTFTGFLGRSPETATPEYLRRFQLHQTQTGRLIAFERNGVTFKYKDYRADGRARSKRMTLPPHEFSRRFLIHVLPKGLHRIRHFGLFARAACINNIARDRDLLAVPKPQVQHAES